MPLSRKEQPRYLIISFLPEPWWPERRRAIGAVQKVLDVALRCARARLIRPPLGGVPKGVS
jgi:hypothetical protein